MPVARNMTRQIERSVIARCFDCKPSGGRHAERLGIRKLDTTKLAKVIEQATWFYAVAGYSFISEYREY